MDKTKRKKKEINKTNLKIGDYFKIDNNCEYNGPYIVSGFSKSGLHIYYEDNRTNIKCKCYCCSMVPERVNVGERGNYIYKQVKHIMVGSCNLHMTEKQYNRNKKLKSLLR